MYSSELLLEWQSERAAMIAENQRLREALKPLAKWSNSIAYYDIEWCKQLLKEDNIFTSREDFIAYLAGNRRKRDR